MNELELVVTLNRGTDDFGVSSIQELEQALRTALEKFNLHQEVANREGGRVDIYFRPKKY